MTAPTMPARAAQGKPAQQNQKNATPQTVRPFVVGSIETEKVAYDQTRTLVAGTSIDLPAYEIEPNGFLSSLYILVEAVTTGNSAAVAFQPDAPFSVIDYITFNDTNNKPIVGPFSGYDLYQVMKYGGYTSSDDAKSSPIFSAVSGTGGTGGSFQFVLRLPLEIVKRDALGTLPNKSSSATFDVQLRLAQASGVYSVSPTVLPSVRVRIEQAGWGDPDSADMAGNPVAQNPPAVQTTQYWNKQVYVVNAGALSQRLSGIDSLVRNLVFRLRDSVNSRQQGDADFPDPFAFNYETTRPTNRAKKLWQHKIADKWGYNNAVETAGGRDYGTYPLTYAQDFLHRVGNETRLGYLPVSSATTMLVDGTISGSGAHSLELLVNKVVPAGNNTLALTGR